MRRLARLSLVVGMVAFTAALAACNDTKAPPVAAGPSAADSADQVLVGATYLLSTRGIQRGELRADTAFVLNEQTRFDLRKAHVVFTTAAGAPEGTMDANKGLYNTQTQILEGWGDVLVKLVDGRTLKSPHVTFNQITHQISSDTTYSLTRGGDTQTGTGFTSNQTFTNFKCLGNCGGNVSVLFPAK
jgi:LPS export ABC transporter protein LptC